jgi:hypothetical protein
MLVYGRFQDGFEMLENIEITYDQCDWTHKIVNTPEYISELKNWEERMFRIAMLPEPDSASLELLVLPRHGMRFMTSFIRQIIKNLDLERTYRGAVVAQHTAAEQAAKWHANTLPVGNPQPPAPIRLTLKGRSGESSTTRRGHQGILKRALYLSQV